jgi:hypothetical protein
MFEDLGWNATTTEACRVHVDRKEMSSCRAKERVNLLV